MKEIRNATNLISRSSKISKNTFYVDKIMEYSYLKCDQIILYNDGDYLTGQHIE